MPAAEWIRPKAVILAAIAIQIIASSSDGAESARLQLATVSVTADLDASREEIAPGLGAVSYSIGAAQIQLMGQGENSPFQQVLLQVPGMVQDEFGEVHLRGDHGDLQYRINGVLLPEGLNGFGQEIDTRMIQAVTVMTGTLPAQFGDRTAGIIDVTAKTGSQLHGGELSLYAGGYATRQSSLQLGGTHGKLEYFIIVSDKHDNLGIDNTTSSANPLHDVTNQEKTFGYFSYRLDETSRLTLLTWASYADFQIPDTPGLLPNYQLAGNPAANSSTVNENQNEQNYYGVISYQKSTRAASLQVSAFARYTDLEFRPDSEQDLLFGGVAGRIGNSSFIYGLQADASFFLSDRHTLRGGLLATYEDEKLNTDTTVFPVDSLGNQTTDEPVRIIDNSGNRGPGVGLYLQDEWRLSDRLTLNYGVRYDLFGGPFDRESQLSPRVNFVWRIDDTTSVHAGYARYFVPPTLQYVPPAGGKKFDGTTNAPLNGQDDPQKVERDHYFDAGLSRQITPAWQVTVDSFFKWAKNLIDVGQFGKAVILDDFNYTKATIYGLEISSTYNQGPFTAYGNFSFVQTSAQNINSVQFQFPGDQLAYVAVHSIQLDHQGRFTGSGGVACRVAANTHLYADFLYGNGLRAGFANLGKLPAYTTVSVGVEQVFHLRSGRIKELKLRFDGLNIFDQVYELRNGSGLGIAAPAYGPRRAFYAGLSVGF
ncbi:Outer membrane receptor proteins, mostly Fe transport [Opitutus sp. GAS368]|nr:Outer membrane receptor proteins, mostly Fe transport [Opitutus sp. GAS368]